MQYKSKWYDTWIIPNLTVTFFAARDIKVHRHLRSRVSGAYSMTAILSMEPLIQDVARDLWQKLGEFADQGKPVPMDQWANFFAFDVVGSLAMGGPIGFIERGVDVDGIIRSIHDGFWLMANMGNVPLQMMWFNNPVAQWVVKHFGGKRLAAFSLFLNWLEKRVEERYRTGLGDKRRDLLQHFIEAKDTSGNPVKKADVMIEGVNILGAGADTTTIAILATLGALLRHPDAIRRLQAELDAAYENLGIDGAGNDIPYAEAAKLPYLSAVIKESTRLHPSIQFQLPRVVPDGGVCVGDYQVPEGTICGISPRSMNRSKEVFGLDADEWKPERWIPDSMDDEERIKSWNSHLTTVSRRRHLVIDSHPLFVGRWLTIIQFGMGSRNCIGKNLATVEMFKFISQFFRRFDASLANTNRPWVTKTQWFSFQRNFWVHIRRRAITTQQQKEAGESKGR